MQSIAPKKAFDPLLPAKVFALETHKKSPKMHFADLPPAPLVNRIVPTFHTRYCFKRTLMSMLTPADLTCFLAAIGYVMTKAERMRYMRLERQVFKDTTVVENLIKQGYSVTLVGPRLYRLWDLIRYRPQLLPKNGENRSLRQMSRAQITHTRDDFGTAEQARVDKAVRVWVCITHKKFLTKNGRGETVSHNRDIPLVLPGQWRPFFDTLERELRCREWSPERIEHIRQQSEYRTTYCNTITGAVTGHWGDDKQLYDGLSGSWSYCDDITEDCARAYHFSHRSHSDIEAINSARPFDEPVGILNTKEMHFGLDFSDDPWREDEMSSTPEYKRDIFYIRIHEAEPVLCRTQMEEQMDYFLRFRTPDPDTKNFYASVMIDGTENDSFGWNCKIPLF